LEEDEFKGLPIENSSSISLVTGIYNGLNVGLGGGLSKKVRYSL